MIRQHGRSVHEAIVYLSRYCLEFLFGFNGEKDIRLLRRPLPQEQKFFRGGVGNYHPNWFRLVQSQSQRS